MESLKIRYEAAIQCLNTLHDSLEVIKDPRFCEVYEQLRDSIIQRFEYTLDTFWKFLREYIEVKYGANFSIVSPGEVLRTALSLGIINKAEFDLFFDMVKDRNLTSHTYNENLAELIKTHINNYYSTIKNVLKRIKI